MPEYKVYIEEERYAEDQIPHQSLQLVATATFSFVGPDEIANNLMHGFRDLVAQHYELDPAKLAMTLEKTDIIVRWSRT